MKPHDLFELFIHHMAVEKAMNEGTIRNYKGYLTRFIKEIPLNDISELTSVHIEEFKTVLRNDGISNKTVNYYLNAIRKILKYAEKKKIKVMNPFDVERYEKIEDKEITLLSDQQLDEFLDTKVNPESDLLVNLLYGTGLRIFELQKVVLEDIDFKEKSISVLGKGNKRRLVYITSKAMKMLDEYCRKDIKRYSGPIFTNEKYGTAVHMRWLQKMVAERSDYLMPEGIHVSAHTMRHHFATSMLKKGLSLPILQRVLGHSSIMTTNRYLHYTDSDIKESFNKVAKKRVATVVNTKF
jgi:integrase/recombinase XerC